ncbi:MAG: hypothetical protein KDA21_11985, partial [Phycisphaerales bacterium]|nr:hypothetical protein [Phycisphaerales bacterium]
MADGGGSRFVDVRDAGVLQQGEDLGLKLEASEERAGGEALADDLECDPPAGVVLLGFVDHTHAAAAQFAEDAVRPDPLRHFHGSIHDRGQHPGAGALGQRA